MLEVIESDFARLEADTKAAEESAQSEYDELITNQPKSRTNKLRSLRPSRICKALRRNLTLLWPTLTNSNRLVLMQVLAMKSAWPAARKKSKVFKKLLESSTAKTLLKQC